MPEPVTIKVEGAERLQAVLQRLGSRSEALAAAKPAVMAEASRIMAASQRLVPRDRGQLAASASQEARSSASSVTVTLGYGTRYARRIHENPRAGKTGGVGPRGQRYRHWARVGQWHYLSQPMEQLGPQVWNRVARQLEAQLRTMGGR
jgi:hypothetical protein